MFVLSLINFFIGSCLASHACLIYDRYPDEDIWFAQSSCSTCKIPLTLGEEIPIFSYLFLQGKCHFCKTPIPYELFCFELLGGLSFIQINLFDLQNLFTAIFLFFFMLIAIFDYHDGEIPLFLFIPFIICSAINQTNNFSVLNLLYLLPISIFFLIFIFLQKIGSADFFLYLALSLSFDNLMANLVFLLACFLAIINFLFESKNYRIHFIPYLYVSFILIRLI